VPISEPNGEGLTVQQEPRTKVWKASWSFAWLTYFSEIFYALRGWRRSYYATLTHDFGNINAQTEATQTVTVSGAVVGDVVIVRPTTAVNGIIMDGTVTAANTVTVRAVNYSSGAIDPASQIYTVIVFQQ
jgi:hypothetical protein